jgi:quercetin dioxygenase-like cupin family protein
MYTKNILLQKEFSPEKPIKKDILNSGNFNIVIVCLGKGQEIKPHPEPYAVFFLVLEGKGIFTNSEGSFELSKQSCISIVADEIRGIKCIENLVVLGVQDGHEKSKSIEK